MHEISSMVDLLGMKPVCCRRRLPWMAAIALARTMLVKNFLETDKSNASVIVAHMLIAFAFPTEQDDTVSPFLRYFLTLPHFDYASDPVNQDVASVLQHFARNTTDTRGFIAMEFLDGCFNFNSSDGICTARRMLKRGSISSCLQITVIKSGCGRLRSVLKWSVQRRRQLLSSVTRSSTSSFTS